MVVVVLVAAGAFYMLSGPSSGPTSTSNSSANTTPTVVASTSSTGQTSFPTTHSTESSSGGSTSSSTQSVTSQTSSVAATETLSCISANTTTAEVQQAIDFLNAYSSMTMNIHGTRNGSNVNTTLSFTLVYVSPTTFKVNAAITNTTGSYPATIWLQKTGVVTALYYKQHNYTNSARVTQFLVNLLNPLEMYHQFGTQLVNSTSYFHSTGTSSTTIEGNTFQVTSYTSNSPNVVIPPCGGISYALTTYTLSVGTPTGSSYEIIPHMDIAGTDTVTTGSGTQTATFDYVIQVTAFNVA